MVCIPTDSVLYLVIPRNWYTGKPNPKSPNGLCPHRPNFVIPQDSYTGKPNPKSPDGLCPHRPYPEFRHSADLRTDKPNALIPLGPCPHKRGFLKRLFFTAAGNRSPPCRHPGRQTKYNPCRHVYLSLFHCVLLRRRLALFQTTLVPPGYALQTQHG